MADSSLTAENLSPNYINPAYATPEQLASLREYAKQLMTGSQQQEVHRPWQGVSNIVNALVGGYEANRADKMQQASIQSGVDQTTPLIQQLLGGSHPNTSPSGGPVSSDDPAKQYGNNTVQTAGGDSVPLPPPLPLPHMNAGVDASIDPNLKRGISMAYANAPPDVQAQTSITSGHRSTPEQALLYQRHLMGGPLAAPPGMSQHERPLSGAVDLNDPTGYMHQVAPQYGYNFPVKGDYPHAQANPNFQPPTSPQQVASLDQSAGVVPAGTPPEQPQPSQQTAQSGQMDPRQIAQILQNPYIPKETKDMIMGLVQPKIITDPYNRPMTYRMGDPTGAHMIPGVPGGVMKEGEFGQGVKLPIVITPPASPGGQPNMSVPGSPAPNASGAAQPQSTFGAAQPFINQSIKNATAAKGAEAEAGKQGEAMVDMQNTGLEAKQQVGNLQTIQELGKQSGYGLGPAMQDWMAQHGIYTPGVSEVQAYKNMIPYMGVLLRPEGSGRLMQQELQNFNSAVGGLMTTPAGRETAFQALSRIAQYRTQIGEIASNTDIPASERMKQIYAIEPPKFDWKAINNAKSQQSTAGGASQPNQIDPAAIAEAKRRGLIP